MSLHTGIFLFIIIIFGLAAFLIFMLSRKRTAKSKGLPKGARTSGEAPKAPKKPSRPDDCNCQEDGEP